MEAKKVLCTGMWACRDIDVVVRADTILCDSSTSSEGKACWNVQGLFGRAVTCTGHNACGKLWTPLRLRAPSVSFVCSNGCALKAKCLPDTHMSVPVTLTALTFSGTFQDGDPHEGSMCVGGDPGNIRTACSDPLKPTYCVHSQTCEETTDGCQALPLCRNHYHTSSEAGVQAGSWEDLPGYQVLSVNEYADRTFLVLAGEAKPFRPEYLEAELAVLPHSARPKCCQRFLVPSMINGNVSAASIIRVCGGIGEVVIEPNTLSHEPQDTSISLSGLVVAQSDHPNMVTETIALAQGWVPLSEADDHLSEAHNTDMKYDTFVAKHHLKRGDDTTSICVFSGAIELTQWPQSQSSVNVLTVPDECAPQAAAQYQVAANVLIGKQQMLPNQAIDYRLSFAGDGKTLVLWSRGTPTAGQKVRLGLDGVCLMPFRHVPRCLNSVYAETTLVFRLGAGKKYKTEHFLLTSFACIGGCGV